MKTVPFRIFALGALLPLFAFGGEGDEMLANYLELRTVEIEDSFLREVGDKEDWNKRQAEYRERLGYMLGLSSDRPRTDLKATITGKLEGDGFTVENLHSSPAPGFTSRAISTCRLTGRRGRSSPRCSTFADTVG